MNNVGQGLSQHRPRGGQRFRDLMDLTRRQRHEFRKRTLSLAQSQESPRLAKILMSRETRITAAAADQGIGDYPAPIIQSTQQFVPKNQRRFPKCAVAKKAREIGSAHTRHFDGNLRLVAADPRSTPVLKLDFAGGRIDQCSHFLNSISAPSFIFGSRSRRASNVRLELLHPP